MVALVACLPMGACSRSDALDTPSLSSRAPVEVSTEETPLDPVESSVETVPVPPADGPRLAPLELASPVYAKPDKQAEKIGYLRIGAQLARSLEPVSMRDCSGGWYAVRPLGFVCAGEDATLRLDEPRARAITVEPDRSRAMPYAYAFTRSVVPNYMRLPTPSEQLENEPGLELELAPTAPAALPAGAKGVPSGRNGLAVGPIFPASASLDDRARFGGGSSDEVPWWLKGSRQIPNLAPFDVAPSALVARSAPVNAGVALIGTFMSDEPALPRRFAVTTDGRLLPTDKLRAETGSVFHGQDLRDTGLPVAFAWKTSARFWSLESGRLVPGRALARREFVPLTGSVRLMGGARMVEARDGHWLKSDDLRIAMKPSELPWYAQRDRRWLDVSILNQLLVAWEGDRPVFATLVSTGKDGLGDPRRSLSTPQGEFRIQQKHVTTTMDSTAADDEFELREVPWVMYFQGGYALHGAYWHDDFGRKRSHGCINLSPLDARHVFEWSLPDVPEHWHGSYASESFGPGTLIRIGR
jgi:L,D-transpeptidase catalytic domain